MVSGLAFLATAIATVFAQATGLRWSRGGGPHDGAWTVALAVYALASAALATGESTGWDAGSFRAFYLLGAILEVPWLALGTVFLLFGPVAGRRTAAVLLVFSGFAAGVLLSTPLHGEIARQGIPAGRDHFDTLPRVLAGVGSGLGATVVFGGALWSALRFARRRGEGQGRLAAGNLLIATGTLLNSSGGLLQGVADEDTAFALALALGIAVIYAGFSLCGPSSRRSTLPASPRGSSETSSTRVGNL